MAEHTHDSGCFKSVPSCSKSEHSHDDHCRNYKGQVTCSTTEHRHNYADCYKLVLNCSK